MAQERFQRGTTLARLCLVALALCLCPLASALTALPFAPLRQQLTNEIAELAAIEFPSRAESQRLRVLTRAHAVFDDSSLADGRALRRLSAALGRFPDYSEPLSLAASNLLATYNNQYEFIGEVLLPELPPSDQADAAIARFEAQKKWRTRLNTAATPVKVALAYDRAKSRLDGVFELANAALLIPFPSDLVANSIVAKIGGVGFTASSTAASEAVFSAVQTESGIQLTIRGIDFQKAIELRVPNIAAGAFRYEVPAEAALTFRIGLYTANETSTAAESGAVFVGTTATEVFGAFAASGPGFDIIHGRFRVTISSQP